VEDPTTPVWSESGSESTTLSQKCLWLEDELKKRTDDLEAEKEMLKTSEAALALSRNAHQQQATDQADVAGSLRASVSTLETHLKESRQESLRLSNDLLVAPLRRRLQLAPRAHWPPLQCAGEPGERSHGRAAA